MIAAIIQARMGSTRLPGKVLKVVEGKTLLEHMIERVRRAKILDKIVIATTENQNDDAIENQAKKLNIDVFRGSEENVLDRYYQTAKKFNADDILRLTADCPLMDPAVIESVAGFYLKNKDKYDYVSNVHPPTYPWGMDVEVFSYKALERAWRNAVLLSEREHVTPYFYNHQEIFRVGNVSYDKDISNLRLTVDHPEDFSVVSEIFKELYPDNNNFTLRDILNLYEKRPEIFSSNLHIKRNNI